MLSALAGEYCQRMWPETSSVAEVQQARHDTCILRAGSRTAGYVHRKTSVLVSAALHEKTYGCERSLCSRRFTELRKDDMSAASYRYQGSGCCRKDECPPLSALLLSHQGCATMSRAASTNRHDYLWRFSLFSLAVACHVGVRAERRCAGHVYAVQLWQVQGLKFSGPSGQSTVTPVSHSTLL